jgi:hypothetical protein
MTRPLAAREHARQIRLQMFPDARRLEQAQKSLELRKMYLGHASRKLVEHIGKLRIGGSDE